MFIIIIIIIIIISLGTNHDTLHRIPCSRLLLLCHLHGRKRSKSKIQELRPRPLVGRNHPLHSRLRRHRPRHLEGQDHGLLLRPGRHLIFRAARRHPRLRFRAQGAAAAAAETHDPPAHTGGHADPVPVALLRRRRELQQ